MTKLAVVLAATFAAGVGLLSPTASAEPRLRFDPEAYLQPMAPISGGTRGYIATPADGFAENHGPTSHIVYLNRCVGGCTFTKSNINDAITNQTIIGEYAMGTQFTIQEFAQSEQMWTETVQCVREVYAPYNVQVVTEDPGSVAHHEAVVAGRASDINRPGVLGVAPLNASTCEPKNNVISFSLANDHTASVINLCWTVAQESAHSFGLDHAFECTDPMTYIPTNCGQKFYRNKLLPCGTAGPVECICGGPVQNSHATLLGVHGPNPVPVPPPTLSISAPASGASVPASFSVVVAATDKRGINKLELLVNGWKWNEVAGTSSTGYLVPFPTGLPDGVMDLTVRACTDIDVCGESTVTVTKGAPCADASTCLTGQKCEAGKCFWDPPTGNIGDDCTFAQACVSENCTMLSNGDQFCTETCFGGPNDRCPDGFACSGAVGSAGVCVGETTEGGCCSVGSDATGGVVLANLGLAAVAGVLIGRRRRRKA